MTSGDPVSSFASDIAPLFRDKDVKSMSFMFDLRSYDDVKENADDILETVATGSMPCDAAWSEVQVGTFRQWIADGCPQ
jgi:hypothetical protein